MTAAMTDDARAYQLFVGACRQAWAGPMFNAMQQRVLRDFAASGADGDAAFDDFVRGHPDHAIFGWFERNLQRMKYSGRWGLVPMFEPQREALLARLAPAAAMEMLRLDEDLPAPAYWRQHDIHNHPGGLADDISAFVYQAAVGSGGVVGRPQLHERFARQALQALPPPGSVLDLGCGFGRSTLAFAAAASGATVTGIDLSASCLKLAAVEAPPAVQGRVQYRQANAEATGLPPGSFDLVSSTMLLHELPASALLAVIAESGRVLKPGGTVVHLDFLPPRDPLMRILYDGHADRNNEPFMRDLASVDLVAAHRAAGFGHVEIRPFAESEDALADPPSRWRLPWTMIVATKPQPQEEPS